MRGILSADNARRRNNECKTVKGSVVSDEVCLSVQRRCDRVRCVVRTDKPKKADNWRKALGPYLWHCLQPLRSLCTADAFGCAIPCANAALVVATNNLQNDLADRRWLSVVVSRALEPNGNRVDQIFRKHRCFGSHRHSLAVCV